MDRKKKWFLKNKELVYKRQNKRNNTPEGKFRVYQANAKHRGLVFSLSEEQFMRLVKGKCFYCGGGNCGVDRIDSEYGYIQGNCVGCCTVCNRMKLNLPLDVFIERCKEIADKHN